MPYRSVVRLNRFPGGVRKAVTASYDDGSVHDRRLVSIFNEAGLKGTFHLNSGLLGGKDVLAEEEIATLFSGHEVAVHSMTHPHLTSLSPIQLSYEILADRRNLESLAGYPVRGMSYPFGTKSAALSARLEAYGIEYARVVSESRSDYAMPGDWLDWHPTCHHKDRLRERFETFVASDPWVEMALFYFWGHSFEFHREDNWEVVEEFAKLARNHREELWFATNIEIKDYMEALRQVKISLDGTRVLNPSAHTVWMEIDGEAARLAPGNLLNCRTLTARPFYK